MSKYEKGGERLGVDVWSKRKGERVRGEEGLMFRMGREKNGEEEEKEIKKWRKGENTQI